MATEEMHTEFQRMAYTMGWDNRHLKRIGERHDIYEDWSVQPMWMAFKFAWKASRAALVVELPPTISHCNTLESGFVMPEAASYDEAIEDCREALTKVGVTVK